MFFKFLFGEPPKHPSRKDREPDDPRRRFKRKIIHSNPPKGELLSSKGRLSHVTLWDVSQGGVCVVLGAKLINHEADDELLTLVLKESHGVERIQVTVIKMWEKQESGSTYFGLQYSGPGLPGNTFLDKYSPGG